jgi:hypothetical protein
MALPETITINKTVYAIANMSDASRNQVANIQVVDAEIAHLQRRLAISQTARNAYASALVETMKTKSEAKPAAKAAAKAAAKPAGAAAPRKPAAPRAKKA